jgi:hypothetical protein
MTAGQAVPVVSDWKIAGARMFPSQGGNFLDLFMVFQSGEEGIREGSEIPQNH